MNNVSKHDAYNLELLYQLAGNAAYNPPTYTCIREFTDSFPQRNAPEFQSDLVLSKPAYKPEDPYPRIYNSDYKTTILASP